MSAQTESLVFSILLQLIIPQKVIMAITTTVMTGPLLRVLLARTSHAIPAGVQA